MVRQGRRSKGAGGTVSTARLAALLQAGARPSDEGPDTPDQGGDGLGRGRTCAGRGSTSVGAVKGPESAGPTPGRFRWRIAAGAVLVVLALVIGGVGLLLIQSAARQFQAQTLGSVPSPKVLVPAVGDGRGGTGSTASPPAGGTGLSLAGSAGATSPAAGPGTGLLVVHVAGAVVHPGIVELPPNSRVYQAIERAGGGTPSAAVNGVNLAAFVQDGEQLVIPTRQQLAAGTGGGGPAGAGSPAAGARPAAGAAAGAGAGAAPGAKVNLNTASAEILGTLPRVGPVLAQRIIDWRTQHGRFASVQELDAVDGVGAKMLESLLPLVTV